MADIKRKKTSTDEKKDVRSKGDTKSSKPANEKKEKAKKPFAYHLIPYVFALIFAAAALVYGILRTSVAHEDEEKKLAAAAEELIEAYSEPVCEARSCDTTWVSGSSATVVTRLIHGLP